MIILAFDTCLDKMYVSLSDNDNIIDSKIVENTEKNYHSAFLISTVRNILIDNNFTADNIDVIATNIGPGSFTGIRACTTVARVFSQSLDKEVKTVGISSLEILSMVNETNKKTLVALDARKEMAYIAVYDKGSEIVAPRVILISELKELILKNDYFIVTDNKLKELLNGVSYVDLNKNLGNYLIEIALKKINFGGDYSWNNLHPLYIQPPAITVKK